MKSKRNLKAIFSKRLVLTVVAVIVLFLVVLQAKQFKEQGSLLGYTVKEVDNSNRGADGSGKNIACQIVSEDIVEEALGVPVSRGIIQASDQTKPQLRSSCSYRTEPSANKPVRTISIRIKEYSDASQAGRVMELLEKRGKGESQSLADKAYFVESVGQLTVQKAGKTATITITPVTGKDSGATSEDAATKIANVIIKEWK